MHSFACNRVYNESLYQIILWLCPLFVAANYCRGFLFPQKVALPAKHAASSSVSVLHHESFHHATDRHSLRERCRTFQGRGSWWRWFGGLQDGQKCEFVTKVVLATYGDNPPFQPLVLELSSAVATVTFNKMFVWMFQNIEFLKIETKFFHTPLSDTE